jgi:hypothetical protein
MEHPLIREINLLGYPRRMMQAVENEPEICRHCDNNPVSNDYQEQNLCEECFDVLYWENEENFE